LSKVALDCKGTNIFFRYGFAVCGVNGGR